ncbi:hypothetical protein D1823_05470 [Ruegeria sp. AD91A]|nr:hypothetical protein D1823_05470 [Ruegeria sp. AD91A]
MLLNQVWFRLHSDPVRRPVADTAIYRSLHWHEPGLHKKFYTTIYSLIGDGLQVLLSVAQGRPKILERPSLPNLKSIKENLKTCFPANGRPREKAWPMSTGIHGVFGWDV